MIGINEENLDKIIKLNNIYTNQINDCSEDLIQSIIGLDDCFSGKELSYIFEKIIKQINTIKSITKVIDSYSSVLNSVKVSYQSQDQNIRKCINSKYSN